MASSDRPRRRSSSVPLLLIGLGLYFLGQRLGWFNFDLLSAVLQFWPAVLIIIGLSLILGRQRPGLALVIGVVLTAALIGGLAIIAPGTFGTPETAVQSWSDPAQGVRSGTVQLAADAADIYINALPAADPLFASGTFSANRARLDHRFVVDDGVADLQLDSNQRGWFLSGKQTRRWDISLSPDVPLDLSLDASAASVDADLSQLRLTHLDVESNAGDVTLHLPSGDLKGNFDINAASLVINVPTNAAAQFTIDANISSIDIGSRFTQQGNIYRTDNWDDATQRIELTIDANAASIELR